MILFKLKLIKWPYLGFVFAGFLFISAFLCLAKEQETGESFIQPSGLRFDGVYKWDSEESPYWKYLRFYEDGTVFGITTKKSGALENLIRIFNKTHNNKGFYIAKDSTIEFSLTSPQGTIDYKGTIEQNGLKLESHSHITDYRDTREYLFIRFPEELLKKEATAEAKQKSLIQFKIKVSDALVVAKILLGQGHKEGDKCSFTPFDGPPQYPPGTRTIAYQVILEPPTEYSLGVNVDVETYCESRVLDTCDEYAMVNGRAVKNKWTAYVSCGEGEQLVPGTYSLRARLDETIVEQISFEIK